MAEPLLAYLESLMPEAMNWLKRMVEINSFTTNAAGINALGSLTADCFAELGFVAEQVPSTERDHGAHLFLRCGNVAEKPVLLVTHLDTVYPPEEELRNDFHWQESPTEGRIYGPGTVDIKGGTILIWMMLRALRELHPQVFAQTHWLIAANAAEEVMSADFDRQVKARCAHGAEAVLVFEGGPREGTEYHVVTSRKGRAVYRLTAHGKGAHAGSSHAEGVNAIVGLSEAVQTVANLTDYAKNLTVNIGRVEGGTVLNRVPHEALAELEMRAYEPAVLSEACQSLEALEQTHPAGTDITVERLGMTPGWPEEERGLAVVDHWSRAAAKLGFSIKATARGGLSDANYLCDMGPTLDGLGPTGANAHCSERSADGVKVPEYVEPSSFVPKAALNVLALLELVQCGALTCRALNKANFIDAG